MKKAAASTETKLDDKYPYLSEWIMNGWVEIGQSDEYRSMAKAFDEGGQVFEGGNKRKIKSLEDALNSLELGIKKWCDENGIDLLDES